MNLYNKSNIIKIIQLIRTKKKKTLMYSHSYIFDRFDYYLYWNFMKNCKIYLLYILYNNYI